MYEFTSSAVNILFIVCAAATIITAIVKLVKDKKDRSDDDGKK